MKMEETEYSETSAYKIQTPGNYPEEIIRNLISILMALLLFNEALAHQNFANESMTTSKLTRFGIMQLRLPSCTRFSVWRSRMMIHGLNPGKVKDLFLLQIVQAGSGANTTSHSTETGAVSPGIKRSGVIQQLTSSDEFKYEWSYTSTPSMH